jgi:hypothetical protein
MDWLSVIFISTCLLGSIASFVLFTFNLGRSLERIYSRLERLERWMEKQQCDK